MPVEMLWERADADQVLASRFGHADEGDVERWLRAVLGARWGVDVRACERVVMSDHNALAWLTTDRGRLLAKWSVDPRRTARLDAAARLTSWLGARGLPVSAPIPSADGDLQLTADGRSIHLQHQLDGVPLDVADDAQVAAAGATLATLHAAMADFPGTEHVARAVGQHDPVAGQLRAWLGRVPEHLPAAWAERLRELFAATPGDRLPVQVVHGDYRAANVLLSDGRVVGVLDLEELRLDHRVVELARSAVLLGTLYHDWAPVPVATRATFRAGYESVLPLDDTERAWWDVLVPWYSAALVPAGDDPTGWGRAAAGLLGD